MKPVLGVMPRKLWMENRIIDLYNAIERYNDAGKDPHYLVKEMEELAGDYALAYPNSINSEYSAAKIAWAIGEQAKNEETTIKAPQIVYEVRSFDGVECRESRTVAKFAKYEDAWEVAQREKCYDQEVMGSVHPIFVTDKMKIWFSLRDYDAQIEKRWQSEMTHLAMTREQLDWIEFNNKRRAIGWYEVSFEEYRNEMKHRVP